MADLTEQIIKGTNDVVHNFRRRVMGGVVVLGALAFPWHQDILKLATNSALLGSTTFALLATATVYLAGALVELVAEVFVARLAGNYLWAFVVPFAWFPGRRRSVRYLLRAVCFLPAGVFLAYYYVARGIFGQSDFRWLDRSAVLSVSAEQYFHSLPESVIMGLQHPFGDHRELAWRFLESRAGAGSEWLRSLENRNRDVLTLLTAFLFAIVIFQPTAVYAEQPAALLFVYVVGPVVIFAYFLALKKSTIVAVEWLATLSELTDEDDAGRDSRQPTKADT